MRFRGKFWGLVRDLPDPKNWVEEKKQNSISQLMLGTCILYNKKFLLHSLALVYGSNPEIQQVSEKILKE